MISSLAVCNFVGAEWLFFSSNVPPIVYYSHAPNIIIALFLAFFVLFQNRKNLANQILFFTLVSFVIWVFFALVFWATNRSDVVMFSWMMDIYAEPLVYIGAFYLVRVLVSKGDITFWEKIILALLYTPIIVLGPTALTLSGFDVPSCLATEGPVALYYTYFVEVVVTLSILIFAIKKYWYTSARDVRREIAVITTGTILFLAAFSWGNITGSFTENWQLGLYGLFGMPVFIGFLVYSIVRFRTFNIKLIGAQALIFSLVALIGSQFFFIQNDTNRLLTAITLIITGAIGINLIRSVKKEIAQREHIEKLAGELQETNKRQETLMHFIGHEVKGYLTKDASVFASLSEGDFGQLPDTLKPIVSQALAQSRDGARSVTDILTASNQKKGTVSYTKESFDLKALVSEIVEKAKTKADEKNLSVSFSSDDSGAPYTFNGDKGKLGDNVLRNVIDNSINYTSTGSISVSLKKENQKFVIAVKDTGIGITEEDKKRLFTEGGHGENSQKINVHSTGYGLFIAKNIVEAHGGTIRAESEGEGKGSTFIVELPITA